MRRVLSGEFTVVNQHLLHDLSRLGLWSPELKNELVAANGSVQVGQRTHSLASCSAVRCVALAGQAGGDHISRKQSARSVCLKCECLLHAPLRCGARSGLGSPLI